jgi:hypothetical protein|tara:strand:+ start:195 stop:458 length:264 start_codon:yes stop_codon:yes gene_type:complete
MDNTTDNYLLDKKVRKFSEVNLKNWYEKLKVLCPDVDEGMIKQTLDAYSTHPHIFDDLVADHKLNPDKYKPKEPEPLRFAGDWANRE